MKTLDFTTNILVDQSPEEAFAAIGNVRGWWSEEIEGSTQQLSDVFNYHYEDVHRCKIKLIEVTPASRIVWLVLENYFKFTKDSSEWTGTKIIFNITKEGNKTQVVFMHKGLVPDYECYEICRGAWSKYIQTSLYNLITIGKGQPNGKGQPQTDNEKKFSTGGN
jgi:hypothetical protein